MKDKLLEKMLKAVANGRRINIIRFLKKKKEASVGDIAKEIKLSFRSTSRHLNILNLAEITEREQRNTQVFYKLINESGALKNILSIL